ncbi:hypothetical protein ACFRCI_27910 [Streptomyces sp. NPDC056638]|uniref:hypothetical protein n=1 Tax=Streptomyces sp. NPDC056638 TaxID=3345887 RepID=UPI003678932A
MNATRVWTAKAQQPQLLSMASCGLSLARQTLHAEYGFSESALDDPTVEQLTFMLTVLDPPLARCALYGMTSPDAYGVPFAMLAREYEHDLRAAADCTPPPHARDMGAEDSDRFDPPPSGVDASATHESEAVVHVSGPEHGIDVEVLLAELRHSGVELATALRAGAADVEAGLLPAPDTADALMAWIGHRIGLAELVGTQGGDWRPDTGYAAVEAEMGRLKELWAEQLAALRWKKEKYTSLLEMADDDEEAADLRRHLKRIEQQMCKFGAADGCPVPLPDAAQLESGTAVAAARVGAEDDTSGETTLGIEEPTESIDLPVGSAGSAASTELQGPDEWEASADADQIEPEAQPTLPVLQAGTVSAGPTAEVVPDPVPVAPADAAQSGRLDAEGDGDAMETPTAQLHGPAAKDEEPWPTGVGWADWDPRAPWDSGTESPVVRLLREGRVAEAYWMTAASDERAVRARSLAFAAAAFGCVSETEATPVQIAHEFDPALAAEDRDAHLVALVAALRTGVMARWPHALISEFVMPSGLPDAWQNLLDVMVAAVRESRAFEPGMLREVEGRLEANSREEIGQTARQLLDDLPRRRMKYQRASQVLQYLAGPSGILRQVLNQVIEWSEQRKQGSSTPAFRVMGEELWRTEDIDRLIEATDSLFRTSRPAKEPITAGARRQLHTACRSVGEVLMRAEAASVADRPPSSANERGIPELASLVRTLSDPSEPSGVGGAALGLLRRWLADEYTPVSDAADRLRRDGGLVPLADCLLGLPDLPRQPDGEPELADSRTARRIAALLAPIDIESALSGYLATGDLHLARALIKDAERDPAAHGCATSEWSEAAWRRLTLSHDDWRKRIGAHHREAAVLLAQMRTLNQLAPDVEREFAGRLQEFADGEESGRYHFAIDSLELLRAELSGLVEESTRALRENLVQLRRDPDHPFDIEDFDRIDRLIDEGDTVTAQEFLALATSRELLPERLADDGSELVDFLAAVTASKAPKAGGEGVDAQWWATRYGRNDISLTQAARSGLDSWAALCTKAGRNSEWQQHIPRVLRLLGLELHSSQLSAERATLGQGMRRFKVRASVAERAGYVAALGSRATSYTILLVWEEQPADGPLAHLEDADVGANVVLYLHPLGAEGRRGLAESARHAAQQALVVDSAVMGWMAARAPGAFRSLQRVTLPWAAYNPYTPFVAGLVPPEVFYGRDEEMREVMGRESGMFLYGGRQLGKSALLRRVAEIFPSRAATHVAVYLDLLKAEIGHAEAPERIWSRLVEDLKRKGVFSNKMSEQAGPDVVVRNIRAWLDEDDTRRLLVLADEADAFLNTDSRQAFRVGSESTFPNVMHFQRLMEQTERRFKIVFAGLHQVQRFGHLSNVSTVHGGPDVLIGPLGQQAAIRLVTEPMAALGYSFERPELVWRILAITNYQANLVQIFCRELVRALHARPYAFSQGPVQIGEDDVQKVAASETVRRQIAERLRFTINLEDRYRVLALVIALRSLEDSYRGDYSASELLQEAREAWPQGFERLSAKQVQIFLTEMVGLGLLIQLGDRSRFAVRSPNVVNMLGTREELELELKETEFGLPYDYNPRAARRVLGRDRQNVQRYSPLTEEQLHDTAQPGTSIVGTTDLYRPDLVVTAVAAFAENRGVEVLRYVHGEDLTVLLKGRRRRAHVVIADLRGTTIDQFRAAVLALQAYAGPASDKLVHQTPSRAGGNENRSAVVVADAAVVGELAAAGQGEELSVRHLRPERWTADALRAWSECPFVSREDRSRLVAATGGWPHWMEAAVTDVSVHGATLDSAVERTRTMIGKPANAELHLRGSGLEPRDVELLTAWTSYVEEGQGVPRDDVQAAVELTDQGTGDWLIRLERLGLLDEVREGFAVEPVTYRAIRARAAAGES